MGSSYTQLLFHVVFSTKERQSLITPQLQEELYKYIEGIVRGEGGSLVEIGGIHDHVHLAVRLKADMSLADIVRRIKANSSKWVNERPDQKIRFQWQEGYGAFTVSQSQLDKLLQYIRTQEEHHRKKTFQEELVEFLRKQKIDYREEYLWA